MAFPCSRCDAAGQDRLYFGAYLNDTHTVRSGFLCTACHDRLHARGRVVGYLPLKGDGMGWVAKVFTMRALQDAYPARDFRYPEIVRIARAIRSSGQKDLVARLGAVAEGFCWAASAHGDLDTFEGWLFGSTAPQVQALADEGERLSRDKAHRQRAQNVLAFYDAMVQAAVTAERSTLIKAMAHLSAATFSSAFSPTGSNRRGDDRAATDFLRRIAAQATNRLPAHLALQGLATRDPWVVFLSSRLGHLRVSSIPRIADMLQEAIADPQASYRKEIVLRAIHWDALVVHRLNVPSSAWAQ